MSLFILGAEERIGKENKLLKVGKFIDWSRVGRHLKGFHKNQIFDQGGQGPYDPLKMFKAILLGQWHSLSDPGLEESLRVRLDFMLFTGFELTDNLPDYSTFCRFRNRLIEKKLHKKLLNEINR
jgi:transposase, IS5 family